LRRSGNSVFLSTINLPDNEDEEENEKDEDGTNDDAFPLLLSYGRGRGQGGGRFGNFILWLSAFQRTLRKIPYPLFGAGKL
jgi:hypothetical protein